MKSILIPVNMILKSPQSSGKSYSLFEVTGWAECILISSAMVSREDVNLHLKVSLVLKRPDGATSAGKVVASSVHRMNIEVGGAALLERTFNFSGELRGVALVVVFRISAHQVDIMYMRLLLDQG